MLVLSILCAYLLGAIPTGYLVARLKGIDIRTKGSGNIGATNVFRVLGKESGLIVLGIDILKGVIAVSLISNVLRQDYLPLELYLIILIISAVVGHSWPIYLGFKGGKGVATATGGLIGLSLSLPEMRLILLLSIISWLLIFRLTHYVSLSSLSSAYVFFIACLIFFPNPWIIVLGASLCVLITYRHRDNIKRLLRKEEGRL